MNQNNSITYLVGQEIGTTRPLEPYDDLVCEFLSDLSKELRQGDEVSTYPDIMAFSFWCRKANISKLRKEYENSGDVRLGQGVVFHIAPSNVPVNFAFSFVFGLLSGNANIVRVPSKWFPQVDIICATIQSIFARDNYRELGEMNAIVSYEQNDTITGALSATCNARVIWGGDITIRNVRKLMIPERSIDIAFSDRYSICVIDVPTVISLDEVGLAKLAQQFFNDTYLMDQNACSSPHLIVWKGDNRIDVKELFWEALYHIVSEKYELAEVSAVDKYTMLCHNAIEVDNIKSFSQHGNFIYRIDIDRVPDDVDDLRGKCGHFYEHSTDDINDIASIVNTKYQTLTYFGIDKSELLSFVVDNRLSGIDRIVPVGQALDIGVIWDGFDIVRSLSRVITVN
jgi:hypothetical protein